MYYSIDNYINADSVSRSQTIQPGTEPTCWRSRASGEPIMSNNTQEIDQEPLQAVLEVPDHDSLQALMSVLNENELAVTTKTITQSQLSDQTTAEIDLDVLTDKQRETLELALRMGYYERPRDANLTDLSDELGISKSAVSQRLRTAEIKLIKTALGRYT